MVESDSESDYNMYWIYLINKISIFAIKYYKCKYTVQEHLDSLGSTQIESLETGLCRIDLDLVMSLISSQQ